MVSRTWLDTTDSCWYNKLYIESALRPICEVCMEDDEA